MNEFDQRVSEALASGQNFAEQEAAAIASGQPFMVVSARNADGNRQHVVVYMNAAEIAERDAKAAEPTPTRYVSVATLRERLEAAGKWDDVTGALTVGQMAKLLSLREGVATDDAQATALLQSVGADPNTILAPE